VATNAVRPDTRLLCSNVRTKRRGCLFHGCENVREREDVLWFVEALSKDPWAPPILGVANLAANEPPGAAIHSDSTRRPAFARSEAKDESVTDYLQPCQIVVIDAL